MGNSMIGLLVILGGLTAQQAEAMIVKNYGTKHGKGGMFFNAILCLFAVIYFFITDTNGFTLPMGIFLYGLVNSTMYATGFYAAYVAFHCGSFGLTRLFTSFNSILIILYGIIFLKEPVTATLVIAIVLCFVSVILMRYQKSSKEETKFSAKWIISVILVVVSNALISVIGKSQHSAFGDTYRNEYLIVSFLGSTMWLMILGLILERKTFKPTIKQGFLYGMSAGIFNGIGNVLSLISFNYFPISYISPVKTGLGMVISFFVSALFYKEKFTRRQIIGVVIGIAAVVLININ